MEMYTFMRQLADSWVLLAMFVFFLGTAIWAFLPSQRGAREDASLIPFRDDSEQMAGAKTAGDKAKTAGDKMNKKLKGRDNV